MILKHSMRPKLVCFGQGCSFAWLVAIVNGMESLNLEGLVYWRVCLLIIEDNSANLLQIKYTLRNVKCPLLDLAMGMILKGR